MKERLNAEYTVKVENIAAAGKTLSWLRASKARELLERKDAVSSNSLSCELLPAELGQESGRGY